MLSLLRGGVLEHSEHPPPPPPPPPPYPSLGNTGNNGTRSSGGKCSSPSIARAALVTVIVATGNNGTRGSGGKYSNRSSYSSTGNCGNNGTRSKAKRKGQASRSVHRLWGEYTICGQFH